MGRIKRCAADNLPTNKALEDPLAVLVGDAEAALRILPSDVVAYDSASAALHACIIGYGDLVLFLLEHVSGTYSDTGKVEGTFQAHLGILDPQVRVFVHLVPVSVQLVLYG